MVQGCGWDRNRGHSVSPSSARMMPASRRASQRPTAMRSHAGRRPHVFQTRGVPVRSMIQMSGCVKPRPALSRTTPPGAPGGVRSCVDGAGLGMGGASFCSDSTGTRLVPMRTHGLKCKEGESGMGNWESAIGSCVLSQLCCSSLGWTSRLSAAVHTRPHHSPFPIPHSPKLGWNPPTTGCSVLFRSGQRWKAST